MFGTVKLKRNRLVDRHSHGLGCRIAVVAGVDCDGLQLHVSISLSHRSTYYFAVVATLRTGTDAGFLESDFVRALVSARAAKPAPHANRMTGPKLLFAASPAK